MKRLTFAVITGLLIGAFSAGARAEWPERFLTLIVAYPAGGNSDIIARIAADWLSKTLKQSVVVQNRGGAGGAIAAELVARSPADGYTLFASASAVSTIIPHMQKVNYDPFRSFSLISIVGSNAVAFAVNPSFPVKTLSEFVAYVKARPGRVDYTGGPAGGISHLTMTLFFKRAGITMNHIPYTGGAPAMPDVLAGRLPMILTNVAEILPYSRAGKLHVIAVSSAARVKQMPDVPTVAEQGYAGFATGTWNGLAAPAGTPREVISKIANALKPACQDSAFTAKLYEVGVEPLCSTPEQFAERLKADYAMWGEAVAATGAAAK